MPKTSGLDTQLGAAGMLPKVTLTAASKRPRNPDFLRRFVHDLYGGECLNCRISRPLAMAHLAPWPTVRASVLEDPGVDPASTAFWRFHEPSNVVLLCCNCHALLDDPKVPEVNQGLIVTLRNKARATSRFADAVRRFVCHEMGTVTRRPVNMNGLAELKRWLQTAAAGGSLPPPHRFVVPWGAKFWHVDVLTGDWLLEDALDANLPCWDGEAFDTGAGKT